jgi:lantibiotic modifying enzyme
VDEPPRDQRSRLWRPILSGRDRESALSVAFGIAEELIRRDEPLPHCELGRGDAGIALFFAYLADVSRDPRHERQRDRLLMRCFDGLARDTQWPGLYGGFLGVAWVFAHLMKRGVGSADVDFSEIDGALVRLLRRRYWGSQFDLIGGLVGFSVYANERFPDVAAGEAAAVIVEELAALATRDGDGTAWFTDPARVHPSKRQWYPRGYYDMGMAHGIAGVIASLSMMVQCGTHDGLRLELLREATRWILAHRLPDGQASAFPGVVTPGHVSPPSRLAWCYGDPGVVAALLAASRALGEDQYWSSAVEIAHLAANRRGPENGILDGSLCHGSAGVGHLFNRIYHAAGDERLLEAAQHFMGQTVKMRRRGAGFAGYEYHVPSETATLAERADRGFLCGASGIGLALLAAASDVSPEWDRVLLSDLPVSVV